MSGGQTEPLSADGVIFDMDGVLIDSEPIWGEVLGGLARDTGGTWTLEAQRATAGMESRQVSAYMVDVLGFQGTAAEIEAECDRRIVARYKEGLPEMPGAGAAVRRLFEDGFVIGLASSSNRVLIDLVIDSMGLVSYFAATVSNQDVRVGKPAPDIYQEACRRIGTSPNRTIAVEDSGHGIKSAHAAGLQVLALPHLDYPLDAETIGLVAFVLGSLSELRERVVP